MKRGGVDRETVRTRRKSQRDLGGSFWGLLTLGCTLESTWGAEKKNTDFEASSQASLIRTSGVGPGHCIYKSPSRGSDVQPGVRTADTGDKELERG